MELLAKYLFGDAHCQPLLPVERLVVALYHRFRPVFPVDNGCRVVEDHLFDPARQQDVGVGFRDGVADRAFTVRGRIGKYVRNGKARMNPCFIVIYYF